MPKRHALTLSFCLLAGLIAAIPPAAGVAGSAAAAPPSVIEPTSTVTGVITDAQTGDPIPGACVNVHAPSTGHMVVGTTCANGAGVYTLQLHRGTYRFSAVAAGYPQIWWPNAIQPEAPNAMPIVEGVTRTLNFAMPTGTGTLTGAIRRQDGSPAPYSLISLYRTADNHRAAVVITGPDGTFSRADLPPGDYHMQVSGSGYAAQWYPAATARPSAAVITLANDGTQNVQEQFIAQDPMPTRMVVNVSGRVTDSSGAAVEGATVTARTSTAVYATATTDANGEYSLPNLTGLASYAIRATKPGMATAWNPGGSSPFYTTFQPGTRVVDLVIPWQPGLLRGRVTDFDGSAPPYRVDLSIWSLAGVQMGSGTANLNGDYELPHLPPGQYRLQIAQIGRPTTQYYPSAQTPAEAEIITIAPSGVTEINPVLRAPAFVDVLVTDDVTGEPVAGACIRSSTYEVCTGADGHVFVGPYWANTALSYQFDVLPTVLRSGTTQYFLVAPGVVTPVEMKVAVGAAIEIPVPLWRGRQYQGRLCVEMYARFDADRHQACGEVQGDRVILGPYFATGPVNLLIKHEPGSDVGAQWLGPDGGTGIQADAAVVRVAKGQTTLTPPAKLDFGGDVTVRAFDRFGGPSLTFCADPAYGCSTDTGVLVLQGLGPYAWQLRFTGSAGSAPEWTGGAASRTFAETVQVVEGETTSLPDIHFKPHARVSGITVPAGLSNPELDAFDARTGDWRGRTVASAEFRFSELNTGPLLIRYRGTGVDCWLHQPGGRRLTPYFQATAGYDTDLGIVVQPGVNCLSYEPPLIGNGTPRRPLNQVHRLHFGAWVQAEIATLTAAVRTS